MYLEFALALSKAISELAVTDTLSALGFDASKNTFDMRSYGILEIESCPNHVPGELTSNICFRISKAVADNSLTLRGDVIDPEEIAHLLIGVFPSQNFILEVGGRGYLNASARESFVESLTASFISRGWRAFFSGSSFFSQPAEQIFTWDLKGAMERLAALKDAPTLELLREENQGSQLERQLMLLSLLSDPELDAAIYLRHLHGRQNTPWYVRRFLSDSARYANFLGELQAEIPGSENSSSEMLRPTEKLLLKFRHELFIAQRYDRPERFLSHVLALIRDFYRIFNDPRLRTKSSFPLGSIPLARLVAFIDLERMLVTHGLGCLFGADMKEFLQ